MEEQLLRQDIGQTMDALLSDQERRVLGLRYGLGTGHARLLREAGAPHEPVRGAGPPDRRDAFSKLHESEVISAVAF